MKNKIIIILGMHRSGTSMLAGVLHHLNIDMGNTHINAHASNPFGHFEDTQFFSLNQKILQSAGGSWEHPPGHGAILSQQSIFSDEIEALVKLKNHQEIWGWKDPRTSLTVDLYMPYISNAYFIHSYRNKFAIADSLYRRNGLSRSLSFELIKIYEDRIANFFKRYPYLKSINIQYEEITSDPKPWIHTLCSFIKIEPNDQSIKQAKKFVKSRSSLKRSYYRFRAIELSKKGFCTPWMIPYFIWKKYFRTNDH